ncbi:MAG: hypothetical protein V9E91_07250 [Burkholderiaceae bacterium]
MADFGSDSALSGLSSSVQRYERKKLPNTPETMTKKDGKRLEIFGVIPNVVQVYAFERIPQQTKRKRQYERLFEQAFVSGGAFGEIPAYLVVMRIVNEPVFNKQNGKILPALLGY